MLATGPSTNLLEFLKSIRSQPPHHPRRCNRACGSNHRSQSWEETNIGKTSGSVGKGDRRNCGVGELDLQKEIWDLSPPSSSKHHFISSIFSLFSSSSSFVFYASAATEGGKLGFVKLYGFVSVKSFVFSDGFFSVERRWIDS